MEQIEICPQSIYSFTASQELIDEVLLQVKKVEYKKNTRNLTSKEMFYNENLLTWFDKCVEELRSKIYINIEKLVITSCWANKTTKTQQHHTHTHPNSLISGVFYLTDHKSGNTNFIIDDFWYKFDTNWLLYTHKKNSLTHKIKPKSGQLLLFPSHLTHNTDVLDFKETEERYSISFNTFISGKLGDNITIDINLQTKDYRDMINKKPNLP